MLDRANIKTYDLLLVGDGAGSGWHSPAGWACVMIDRTTGGRKLFYGGMHPASINLAELMPYYHALSWYHANYGKARLRQINQIRVHILTDSQVIANWGTRAVTLTAPLPSRSCIILAGLRELARAGYVLTFHWAARSTSLLNWTCDLVAALGRREIIRGAAGAPQVDPDQLARRAVEAMSQVQFVDPRTRQDISLYDLNPDETSQ